MNIIPAFLIGMALSGSPVLAAGLSLAQSGEGGRAAPLLGGDDVVEFALALEASCGAEETLSSLSVTLADTRLAADPGTLDENGRTELTLSVPANQLKGINRRLLCGDREAAEVSLELLIGAFSANASARCLHPERGSRTFYASTDVDVTVWCGEPETAADSAAAITPDQR